MNATSPFKNASTLAATSVLIGFCCDDFWYAILNKGIKDIVSNLENSLVTFHSLESNNRSIFTLIIKSKLPQISSRAIGSSVLSYTIVCWCISPNLEAPVMQQATSK